MAKPKTKPPPTFGQSLKRLRLAAGLTVQQLADASGVTNNTIWRYEGDDPKRKPSWEYVQRLATALGVSTEALRDR